MATKKVELKELSIAEKLDQLVTLQKLDSSIDEIKILRGELPLEVKDLEDEIEGLKKGWKFLKMKMMRKKKILQIKKSSKKQQI